MTDKKQVVIGYKATDKNMQCRGFQYEVGKDYEHKGDISLCNSGFHFCQNPLDVLNYYNLCDSEFHLVEAKGECATDGDKTVTNNIKISATIGIPGLIKASVEWIKNSVKEAQSEPASGDSSQLAASGYSSKLAASGDYSQLAASGYYSQLAASGDYSQLAASGDYSVVAGIGINCTAKASEGSWITLAEWIYDKSLNRYIPVCVKSVQVDGVVIKADVFYKLLKCEFVETI